MANQSYRRGQRDRHDRERENRDRSYARQAEQFDTTEQGWLNEERNYSQAGETWSDQDYGQYDRSGHSYSRNRDEGRPEIERRAGNFRTPYGRGSYLFEERSFDSFTGNDFGGRDFTQQPRYRDSLGSAIDYGAGTRLASTHGEWRDRPELRTRRDWRDTNDRGWFDRASDEVASWFGDEDAARRREIYDHRGRGPAGYTRSDERILEDACDELTEDWGVDASKIQVTVASGEVTLEGTVPTRQQKRRAEDRVEDLSGVRHVQNNLRVEQSGAWDRTPNADKAGS